MGDRDAKTLLPYHCVTGISIRPTISLKICIWKMVWIFTLAYIFNKTPVSNSL